MLSNKATDNGLFESGILSLKETDASKRRPMIGLLVFSENKASNPSPWSIGLRLIILEMLRFLYIYIKIKYFFYFHSLGL